MLHSVRTRISELLMPVHLLRANVHSLDASWGNFRMVHWFWRIYQVDRPGALVRVGETRCPLTPASITVLPGGVVFQPSCQRPVRLYSVHFDLPAILAPLQAELFPGLLTLGIREGGQVAAIASGICSCCLRGAQDPLAMQELRGWVHLLVAELLHRLAPHQRTQILQILGRRNRLTPALDLIHREFHRPLDNHDIAQALHLSSDHGVRLFRSLLGTTPGRYLSEVRMRAASRLLLDSDASIEAIAERTGYRDRYYFSRVFKKRFGLGPATFRRRTGTSGG